MVVAINLKEGRERKKALLSQVCAILGPLGEHLSAHMGDEDKRLGPLGRKYFTPARASAVVRAAFESAPPGAWRTLLPFYLVNLPTNANRVRMLRCLIWAVPERVQLLGLWCKEGLPGLVFDNIANDIPEMVPRHVRKFR